MDDIKLPPLPPVRYLDACEGYDDIDMRIYARAALAAAPAPEPLTHEQIIDGYCTTRHAPQFVSAFAQGVRFAERAHGIGTDARVLVKIRQQSEPCGECHLQPGELCDICGAQAQGSKP